MLTTASIRLLVIFGLAYSLALSQPSSRDTRNVGIVHLNIVDNYGNDLVHENSKARASIHVVSVSKGQPYDGTFGAGDALPLAYGEYRLTILLPGFLTWDRQIAVRLPRQWLTAAMITGAIDGPAPVCHVQGRVEGSIHNELWVRLFPAYSDEIRDTHVAASGQFDFDEVACGKYFLAVFYPGGHGPIKEITLTLQRRTVLLSASGELGHKRPNHTNGR